MMNNHSRSAGRLLGLAARLGHMTSPADLAELTIAVLRGEHGPQAKELSRLVDWLRRHYTVEENPGMGAQGLYYSYNTMAKALASWGENPLVLSDGKAAWWRKDLTQKLISRQKIDPKTGTGFWINDSGRWWENDPVLASCYALMAMEVALKPAMRP